MFYLMFAGTCRGSGCKSAAAFIGPVSSFVAAVWAKLCLQEILLQLKLCIAEFHSVVPAVHTAVVG